MQATLILNPIADDPQRLFEFYRDVVGLRPRPEMGPEALQAGGATILFDHHRDICGPAREPQRFLMDFTVADAAMEQRRMEAAGAKFIRTLGTEAWGGTISTFVDPGGNYGQLFQLPDGMGRDAVGEGPVTGFTLDIMSTDADRLFDFYNRVVGLPAFPAIGPHGMQVSDGCLIHVDTHSEVTGPAQEPGRMFVNFFVDDVVAERERLEAAGVRFFRKEGVEFWGGLVSSFLDPDGNIVQVLQYDPSRDTSAQG